MNSGINVWGAKRKMKYDFIPFLSLPQWDINIQMHFGFLCPQKCTLNKYHCFHKYFNTIASILYLEYAPISIMKGLRLTFIMLILMKHSISKTCRWVYNVIFLNNQFVYYTQIILYTEMTQKNTTCIWRFMFDFESERTGIQSYIIVLSTRKLPWKYC